MPGGGAKPRIVGVVPKDRNSPAPMVMPGTVFKAWLRSMTARSCISCWDIVLIDWATSMSGTASFDRLDVSILYASFWPNTVTCSSAF